MPKRVLNKTFQAKKQKFNHATVIEDSENTKIEYLPPPNKSKNDKKEYRVIKLENGLIALLISDVENIRDNYESESEDEEEEMSSNDEENSDNEESDESICCEDSELCESIAHKKSIKIEEKMAACGLCVGVGSFSDPPEIPGMAHFLEHMVFMGSEKYPKENDFDSFIKRRGGNDNASTDCETTTFYFECHEKHLLQGLDRFSHFFISPLMKREAMTREREAIESEFQMSLPSDFSRKQQLLSDFAKPNTPIRKFMWGNLKTLKDNVKDDDLYEAVHKFRKRHYSSHRMTLAVQARLPLDTLELWIKACFKDVPNNNLPPDDFSSFKDIFDTKEFTKIYYVKPVRDIIKVEITWVFPSLLNKYHSKPHHYLAVLLGHEGEGSLLSYLRQKVWAVDLFAGNSEGGFEHNSLYCAFMVNITLTEEGIENISEVITAVYSYIEMLRKEGPSKRLYDEISSIEEATFRFSEETPAGDNVEDLAEAMQFYPSTDYITGSSLYFEFNPQAIELCLYAMRPDKCNIIIYNSNSKLSHTHVEKWFGTEYLIADIPHAWLTSWKAPPDLGFKLPGPNPFITTKFNLLPIKCIECECEENNANATENQPYPLKIYSDEVSELWFRQDTKFFLPYAYYYYYFVSSLTKTSAENAALLDLMVAILKQQLTEEVYPAVVAGLGFSIYSSDNGLVIKVEGFNQNLQLLLEKLIYHLIRFEESIDVNLFEAMKKIQSKRYYNAFLKPGKLNNDLRFSILMKVHWNSFDKYRAVQQVSLDQLRDFAKTFLRQLYIQSLVQGNVTPRQAFKALINIIDALKCKNLDTFSLPKLRVNQIPLGETCLRVQTFNLEDKNSIITNYYQSGPASIKSSCIVELITMLMEEPVFDVLRTKEQLGYHVYCTMRDTFGVIGFSVTVTTRSDKYTCEYVNKRIEGFLKSFSKKLRKIPDSELASTKKALSKLKNCMDLHLKEEVTRNWGEIVSGEFVFDRSKREVECIETIKLSEIRKWLDDHIESGTKSNYRKLSIQVVGSSEDSCCTNSSENNNLNVPADEFSMRFLSDSQSTYIKDIPEFKKCLFVYPINRIML